VGAAEKNGGDWLVFSPANLCTTSKKEEGEEGERQNGVIGISLPQHCVVEDKLKTKAANARGGKNVGEHDSPSPHCLERTPTQSYETLTPKTASLARKDAKKKHHELVSNG